MKFGPANESPNPIQRWAAGSVLRSAILGSVIISAPVVLTVFSYQGADGWASAAIVFGTIFALALIIAWVRHPYSEDPASENIAYLPWFGGEKNAKEDTATESS